MRMQKWMAVIATCWIGCASAPAPVPTPAPEAPGPTTAQLSLSGLPDITLPRSPRTAALQEALLATEATRAHEPDTSMLAWRAWSDAGATAALEVERIIASLGDSVEADAARVLVTLLREQLFYRGPRSGGTFSGWVHSERDRALEACVALGEVDARLSPWTQRCHQLIAYWRDNALWVRGEIWPEGCPAVTGEIAAPDVYQTRHDRPALALHIRSELSPRDEARVTAAVARALLARMPNAQVIPAREVRAAEQAFIAMRGLDGGECAAPPTTDERLAHAHPEFLSLEIAAVCGRHRDTRQCALRVQPSRGFACTFMPLHALVQGAHPTAADFEEAAAQLTTGRSVESDAQCIQVHGHERPPSLAGWSSSLDRPEVNAALAPIRGAVQACRDVDLARASIFSARLDVAGDGGVRQVALEDVPGPRRIACVTNALASARFPATGTPHVVAVYGWFHTDTTLTVPMRARAEDQTLERFGRDVDRRLQACVAQNSPMHVIDGTLHVGANGIASRVDGDATDATSVCIRNALVGSAWSCAGERDVPMRLCIGNPVRATEPVRP